MLAEIDAPEYVQSRDQAKAEVEQAEAKSELAKAAVARADADVGAAEAGVAEKQAELTRVKGDLNFRNIQYQRIRQLFELKSIDQRLVEERQEATRRGPMGGRSDRSGDSHCADPGRREEGESDASAGRRPD